MSDLFEVLGILAPLFSVMVLAGALASATVIYFTR